MRLGGAEKVLHNLLNKMITMYPQFNIHLILANKELYANEIEITSAESLDEELKQNLAKKLDCSLKINIDSSMIGGIKLRKGNTIFDNSISSQLNQLKKTLYNM